MIDGMVNHSKRRFSVGKIMLQKLLCLSLALSGVQALKGLPFVTSVPFSFSEDRVSLLLSICKTLLISLLYLPWGPREPTGPLAQESSTL